MSRCENDDNDNDDAAADDEIRVKWASSWSGAIVTTLQNRLFLTLLQNLDRIYVLAYDGCEDIPDICHGRHGRRPCKFFLPGVNFQD